MDIVELLEDLGIDYREHGHEHCRENWVQIDCPDCTPDSNHWRLGIHTGYLYANCWSCGSMPLANTLYRCANKNIQTISSRLKGLRRITKERKEEWGRLWMPPHVNGLLDEHERYLKSRGFASPKKIAKLWDLKSIGLSSKMPWRILIPVHYQGETVSWTTRSIDKKEPQRYLSAKDSQSRLPLKSLLYGIDHARHAIIIVEGPLDVWRIGPGAVATLGTSLTSQQVGQMAMFPMRIVCFDNEKSAQKRAENLVNDLSVFPGETINVQLETGKDPAEAEGWEIQQLIEMVNDR